MSSLISGVGKIFTSLGGSGVVATLGSAVRGVGSALFTTGAATGTALGGGAMSGLFGGGGGVLSNMINGATRILGGGIGGVPGMAAGAVGSLGAGPWGASLGATGATSAASAAGLGAAGPWGTSLANQVLGNGLFPAATPTGFAASGASAGSGGLLGAVGNFLGSDTGSAILAGIGDVSKTEHEKEALLETQGQLIDEKKRAEAQLMANYEVPASAYAGGSGYVPDRTPRVKPSEMWVYDKASGEVKKTTKTVA
jgi:hypothetical protein